MGLKLRRNPARALEGFIARMFVPGELDVLPLSAHVSGLLSDIPRPETAVALQSLQSLLDADLRSLLPTIDLPTLVINGALDGICLPEAATYMARHIADCRHVVISGCGHAPFLTHHEDFEAAS